jgi:hypothetical protein
MDVAMINKLRRCWAIAAVEILAVALAGPAAAMTTCEGTYSAMALLPLPAAIVIGVDVHDRSPENLRLAERFLAGIRKAGVAVGPEPNVLLHVGTSRYNLPLGSREARNLPELSGLQGGVEVGLPAMPDTRFGTPRAVSSPPPLNLRVDATEGQKPRISWTAVVQCRRTSADNGALAEDLGRLIGGALGRRIDRGAV